MKVKILSWLLHHANRSSKLPQFYAIKEQLLAKYGKHIGYDVQHIEGKKCFSCDGTGVYTGYYWQSGEEWHDACYHCYGGWYKRPQWILLKRFKFGKFTFHKPEKREYNLRNPFMAYTVEPSVEGYIDHSYTKHGGLALRILFFMFNPRFYCRYVWDEARAWRCAWWLPRNWFQNLLHLIRYRHSAIPFARMNRKVKTWFQERKNTPVYHVPSETEDLPF
jgi:hypothetical protein